jgi:hypothetical protein
VRGLGPPSQVGPTTLMALSYLRTQNHFNEDRELRAKPILLGGRGTFPDNTNTLPFFPDNSQKIVFLTVIMQNWLPFQKISAIFRTK